MACRFPGNVNDPRAFWDLPSKNGVGDAITEVPSDRWNASRFYHTNAAAPGRMITRWGGFIQNADLFDAAFFGIAPREASRMDPQHRWLLETSWEALEDAGLPPEKLAGFAHGRLWSEFRIAITHHCIDAIPRRSMDTPTSVARSRLPRIGFRFSTICAGRELSP